MYIAAHGPAMANRGEKVTFRTDEGVDCVLWGYRSQMFRGLITWCVEDVRRRTQGRVHQPGGYSQHEGTGQVATFCRDHNVYPMEVEPVRGWFSQAGEVSFFPDSFLASPLEKISSWTYGRRSARRHTHTPPVPRDPGASSKAEVDRHSIPRLPYRSRCPACVSGRARESHHKRKEGQGEKRVPEVVVDYASLAAEGETESLAVLVIRDRRMQMLFAHMVPKKGLAH